MISNLEVGDLISIVNYSTLANFNLVYKQENGLFKKTNDWFVANSNNVFFVIKIFNSDVFNCESYCILFDINNNRYCCIEYQFLNPFQFQKIE